MLAQEMMMEKQIKHKVIQPPPSWVLILRPFLVLGCFVVGLIAFNKIVIEGSILDGKTMPAWSKDNIDLSNVRKAIRSADFAEAESILLKLIKKQPHFGEAHCMLGRLYLQQDRLDDAMRHYRIAHEYLPGEYELATEKNNIGDKLTQQPAPQVQSDGAPSD
jgi:tetratricopeptide (TPR) repeat protein